MSSHTTHRNRELAMLRERKLTTLFNRHFSEAAEAISAERKSAEVALREIERRRAEAALRMANNPGKIEAGQALTKLDEMYLELKRRKEIVRKRERDTLEKYHRYTRNTTTPFAMVTTRDGGDVATSSLIAGDQFYGRTDSGTVVDATSRSNQTMETDAEISKGNVIKNSLSNDGCSWELEATIEEEITDKEPLFEHSLAPTTTTSTTSAMSSLDPSGSSSTPTIWHKNSEDTTADLTEEESKLEESKLGNKNGEENGQLMTKSIGLSIESSSTLDETTTDANSVEIFSVTSYDNSTLADNTVVSEMTGRSSANKDVFVSDAELRLTAFLKAHAEEMARLCTQGKFYEVSTADNSRSARECMEAVIAAERAATVMAEAVAGTLDDSSDKLPEEERKEQWYQYWSEEHGREYFYNPQSGKVTWELPKDALMDNVSSRTIEDQSLNRVEDRTLQTEVQNWSLQDFLPDRKSKRLFQNKSVHRERRTSSSSRSKDPRAGARRRGSDRDLKNREQSSTSSRLHRASGSRRHLEGRSSDSSYAGLRRSSNSSRSLGSSSSGSDVPLTKALMAKPTKRYSLWNPKNMKRRKRVVRRSFWTVFVIILLYKLWGSSVVQKRILSDKVTIAIGTNSVRTVNVSDTGKTIYKEKLKTTDSKKLFPISYPMKETTNKSKLQTGLVCPKYQFPIST